MVKRIFIKTIFILCSYFQFNNCFSNSCPVLDKEMFEKLKNTNKLQINDKIYTASFLIGFPVNNVFEEVILKLKKEEITYFKRLLCTYSVSNKSDGKNISLIFLYIDQ